MATITYVAGGIVLALRLLFSDVNPEAVVGQLPREFLITVGAGQVLLPTLLLASLYAAYRLLRGEKARTPKTRPWNAEKGRNRPRCAALALAIALLLLAPGAIFAVVSTSDEGALDRDLWRLLATVAMTGAMAFLTLVLRSRPGSTPRGDMGRRHWKFAGFVLVVVVCVGGAAVTVVLALDTASLDTTFWLVVLTLCLACLFGLVGVLARDRFGSKPKSDKGKWVWRIAGNALLVGSVLGGVGVALWLAMDVDDLDPDFWRPLAAGVATCFLAYTAWAARTRFARPQENEWLRTWRWTGTGLLLAIAVTGGALAAWFGTRVTGLDSVLWWLLAAFAVTFVVACVLVEVRARIAHRMKDPWYSRDPVAAATALYAGALVPAAIIFWPAFVQLQDAKVCTTAGFAERGDLIGHTGTGVYLAEEVSDDRRIAVLPSDQVEEVFVGPDAGFAHCEVLGSAGKATAAAAVVARQQALAARKSSRAADKAAIAARAAADIAPAIDALKAAGTATRKTGDATNRAAEAAARVVPAAGLAAHDAAEEATREAAEAEGLAARWGDAPANRHSESESLGDIQEQANSAAARAADAARAARRAARAALDRVGSQAE